LPLDIPTAYRPGYENARRSDPELADRYLEHATKGNPLADAVVESMAGMPQGRIHQLITAGMDEDEAAFRDAPTELRDLIGFSSAVPEWFDSKAVYPGCRAFHADSDLYVQALVGSSIVRGFSTLISKSFFATGRLTDHGVRRLRQNIRQLIEIMIPGGLERHGEGWKLSVRVRFVHGRMRSLLARSPDWNHEAWGTPLSAAHLGYAISVFSKRLLDYSTLLGARFSEEERRGVMDVWRYSGFLMGIPESILYSSAKEAEQVYEEAEAEAAAAKLLEGEFTLEDFLEQMRQLKKMGSLQNLVGMLPGATPELREAEIEDEQIAQVEAIICSMTPQERAAPRIIDGSRRQRIAAGSGTRPSEVSQLLRQFSEVQRMMKRMGGGKGPGAGRKKSKKGRRGSRVTPPGGRQRGSRVTPPGGGQRKPGKPKLALPGLEDGPFDLSSLR